MPNLNITGDKADIYSFVLGVVGIAIASLWIRSKEHIWRQKKYRPVAARVTQPDPDDLKLLEDNNGDNS